MVALTRPPPPCPQHPAARTHALLPGSPAACTQCGAPHEPKASVCGYCLAPKLDLCSVDMIEVTTLGDSERRFIPAQQPAPMRR